MRTEKNGEHWLFAKTARATLMRQKKNIAPANVLTRPLKKHPKGQEYQGLAFRRPANSYALLVAFPCGILRWRDRLPPASMLTERHTTTVGYNC